MRERKYIQPEDGKPLDSPYQGFGLSKFEERSLVKILKKSVELVESVPTWTSRDVGRLIYDTTTDAFYVGATCSRTWAKGTGW